jgi:GTP pyrophosphokinase
VEAVVSAQEQASESPNAWLAQLETRLGERASGIALAWQELSGKAPEAATHALGCARQLDALGFDPDTLAASLLMALPDTALHPDRLTARYGASLTQLTLAAARLRRMDRLLEEVETGQGELLRQMLLAMSDDLRVVLIKLAERTQNLRELTKTPGDARTRAAQEAREIYAPLANRLGAWQFKWELEDLACRFLEPDTYKDIARQLDERRIDREQYIEAVKAELRRTLTEAGVAIADISGRPKHIASILAKMRKKQLSFDDLYDVRAVRVLVADKKDCYLALGIVHSLWQPIPGQFDDYVSRPKPNGYQSLHTAVIGPADRALEVQIRTLEMHHESELGVAAHWRYKESSGSHPGDAALQERIAWVRQLLAWRQEISDTHELTQHFQQSLASDEIYAITPQGKVIALPAGATPLDFAYALHTELGHRCRGAKLDGVLVPLDTAIKTGQRVEILTAKQGVPSRDWLSHDFLKTSRARHKVKQWFRMQELDRNLTEGRALLERELHRLGLANVALEKVAERLGHARPEDLYAALGRSELGSGQLARSLSERFLPPPERPLPAARKPSGGSVLIAGQSGMLVQMARCCHPAPPDPIVGYITQGRGVTIHRLNCATLKGLSPERQSRLIDATWPEDGSGAWSVNIEILAERDPMRVLTELLAQEKVGVQRMDNKSHGATHRLIFTIQIKDLDQLSRLLNRASHLPGVLAAKRC